MSKEERSLVGLRCPRCFSRMIYYKVKSKEFQCRFCGNKFIVPLEFPEEEKEKK